MVDDKEQTMNNHDESEDVVEEVEIIDKDEVNEDKASTETEEQSNQLQEEKAKLEDRILRIQAEFENFKRRTAKEKSALLQYKAQDLATELLPILDNFERALETEVSEADKGFYNGVTMVYEQLQQALTSQDVEVMDVVNQEFDPNLHHAVMQTDEADVDSNIIVEELQKGYLLKDKVLRPAMVKVNK